MVGLENHMVAGSARQFDHDLDRFYGKIVECPYCGEWVEDPDNCPSCAELSYREDREREDGF
jgi:rubrerythrin